ncbi:retrovirus-related Pol polyprotein from transposon TNT 1-94 [Trichonephila clavipes]|nr:retrovirus-related Pol polyprotein from transposon TNT 1-94 [Trichonephila clavipes]
MDVCPIPTPSHDGSNYFLSITDDYSWKVTVFPIKRKSDVFNCFTRYQKRAETFLNNKIVNVRIDNGLEFIRKEFCKFLDSQGIEMERTNTYSPEMNGQLRNKLNMKTKKGITVGYSVQTKGYRVWIPEEEKVIETCNVSFNESINGEAVLGLNNKSEYTFLIMEESESDMNWRLKLVKEMKYLVKILHGSGKQFPDLMEQE